MRPVVLVADIDGTLTNPGEPLLPELKEQLLAFSAVGRFVVATGRHPKSVALLCESTGRFFPTISLGGAALHLQSWNAYDDLVSLSAESVGRISELFADSGLGVAFFTPVGWYALRPSTWNAYMHKATGLAPDQELLGSEVVKAVLVGGNSELSRAISVIQDEFAGEVSASVSAPHFLDIVPRGVDKATFLPKLLDFVSGESNERLKVVFVGDAMSDIPCARLADTAWTFHGAPSELKAASAGILTFDAGRGVVELLKQLLRNI